MKKNIQSKSKFHFARSWWFIACVCVFVLIGIFSLRRINDVDIGFHLRGGEWMLEHRSFHHHDVFTYTVNQNEYTALHWLYQIIIYFIYLFTGYTGITLFSALAIMVLFLLIAYHMKLRQIPLWICAFCLLMAVCAMEVRFSTRPELVTWIFLVLTYVIIDLHVKENKRLLYWLPVVQLLWVNLHGLFILGWFVAIIYIVSVWIHTRRLDRALLGWSGASIIASCINPYFLKGVSFPLYLFTRMQSSNIFKTVNAELQPTLSLNISHVPLFSSPLHWYFLCAVVTIVGMVLTIKKRRLHEYVFVAVFLYLSLVAMRNIALFIVVALLITPNSLSNIASWIKHKWRVHYRYLRLLPHLFIFIVILICVRVMTNAYYLEGNRATLFGAGLNTYTQPVSAAGYLLNERLQGRIINDFNTGSWLIWTLPQPVFIDGRMEVMQEEFFEEYRSSFYQHGLLRLIERYKPDLIIFDYSVTLNWQRQLMTLPEWRCIYWDEKNVIYAHHFYAPYIKMVRFGSVLAHKGLDTAMTDAEAWDILKIKKDPQFIYWLKGFFLKRNYPHDVPMRMALFAYSYGDLRTAELLLLEFIRRIQAPMYEPYFNLGAVYLKMQDYIKARYCYEQVIQYDSNNLRAQQYLRAIPR